MMTMQDSFIRPDSTAYSLSTTLTDTSEQEERFNSESFIVIWLDENVHKTADNVKLKSRIRSIVNCFITFDTLHECIDCITQIKEENIFFIVSGSIGEVIVPQIHEFPHVEWIYIFCADKAKHELWSKPFEKVQGIFNDLGSICNQLQHDIQQCSNNLISFVSISATAGDYDENLNRQEVSFMHLKLIKNIFLRMNNEAANQKVLDESKAEMITFLRRQYMGNESGLKIIDEFENDYCAQKSIKWYTRGCFIYESLNKALRTLDVDTLYKFRFFIIDLHEQLDELHREASTLSSSLSTVYRGQALVDTEFQKLQNNCGGLLSINNFLSTTTNCEVATGYAEANSHRSGFKSVLFEIELDTTMKPNNAFANIQHLSHFGTENEVLFSMASVFRIQSIEQLTDKIWIVTMKLTNDEDEQLKNLTDHIVKEVDRTNNLASLGLVLVKMGEFKKSNFFFNILLNELILKDDIRGLSMLYNDIGSNYQEQGELMVALTFYEKSIEIISPHLEALQEKYSHDSLISSTYNNIGMIHKTNENFKDALKYIRQALEYEQKHSSTNQQLIATYYQNIGIIYDEQAKYSEALEMFNEALDISSKHLPSQHPLLAAIYCNIGSVYYNQNNFEEALKMFDKTLKLELISLPPTHISLAFTYNNIAFAYYGLGKYADALRNMKRTVEITLKTLPSNHPLAIQRQAGLDMMTGEFDTPEMNLFYEKCLEELTKSSE
ncbi:hypothetical protein I4U23_016015 [Adineta vaga]|nr:hypothetical protein I4U23_016015 [Adineta vaga]